MVVASDLRRAVSGRLVTGVGSTLLGTVLMKLVFDRFHAPLPSPSPRIEAAA
jgi:hypothetical protein